ncbi:cx9C motif-containing protein 4 [Leguminivora glycinivorella]|uniref:cx9C motif-containing protein 4 n=1 Tax=Leguminivora glycinivorella TaxID=1035111 RepID=UPI00200DB819|nr:cx9C motif-containing protein 4 [Leguminivora glycinivorella]
MPADPCKKFACEIQRCLVANNFQEVRCDAVFEAMRQCCLKHKPVSLVCSGYDLKPREFAPVTDRPQDCKK